MTCPFCHKEMKSGTIRFSARTNMRWIADDENKSGFDRFCDSLGGIGCLTGVEESMMGDCKIKSDYCPTCKKMIFETDITK